MALIKVVQMSLCVCVCSWFDCHTLPVCVSLHSLTEQNKCFPGGFVERMKKTLD